MQKKFMLLGILTVAACSQCGLLDTLILKPTTTIRRLPTDFGYAYETMVVPTPKGNQISLWHVHTNSPVRKGIIVTIPGNDANKSRYVVSLPLFADNGWDLVLIDYTGFGESPGEPTLQGLFDSAYGAIDYAKSQSDVVVGYGISLGTGVLARVAADRDLTAVVFESMMVFYETPTLFAENLGIDLPVFGLANWIAEAGSTPDLDSKRWIQQVSEPKLFIHSPGDHVTPFAGAMEVFTLAPQPKHMFVTQGEHALQAFTDPGLYRNVVNGWLDGVINQNPIENELYLRLLEEEIEAAFQALGLPPPPPGTFTP